MQDMGSCQSDASASASNKAATYHEQIKFGDLQIKNRIAMASMTRCRCDPKDSIPNDLLVQYYSERAGAGVILTECAPVSNAGNAFPGAGGIYTKEQAEGWKKVTDKVHENGSKIYMQIWHGGRSANPEATGEQHIAPSAVPVRKVQKDGTIQEEATPKEMTLEDIEIVKKQFKEGAILAKQAGFDGLELHGANGYLVDQFIRDGTNKRTDRYGGSVENRSRLCLELIDILIGVFGSSRIGIKLSPVGRYGDMYDSDPLKTYTYLVSELDKRKIAFIQFMEPTDSQIDPNKKLYTDGKLQIENVAKTFRPLFNGTLIANCGFSPDTGIEVIKNGYADMISFARLFITNPDLVDRIKNNWTLNQDLDFATFFAGGENGYNTYKKYDSANNK